MIIRISKNVCLTANSECEMSEGICENTFLHATMRFRKQLFETLDYDNSPTIFNFLSIIVTWLKRKLIFVGLFRVLWKMLINLKHLSGFGEGAVKELKYYKRYINEGVT